MPVSTAKPKGVLGAIGNTPLIELNKVVPSGSARVLAKLEWANPTGSMKDRVALAMVEAAERDGRLPPGGTVVEYTAGTTGISLALVCAAKGYRLKIVFSDAFSEEKGRTMRAFGAEIVIVPSDQKRITEALIREMIATAGRLSKAPNHWWSDQLAEAAQPVFVREAQLAREAPSVFQKDPLPGATALKEGVRHLVLVAPL